MPSGRPEETEAHVKEAMRLSPLDPGVYIWYDFVCVAKTMTGQDEDAFPWGRKAAEANRGYPMAHFHYAAPLALCGRLAEARSEVTAGLALAPNFTILLPRGHAERQCDLSFATRAHP